MLIWNFFTIQSDNFNLSLFTNNLFKISELNFASSILDLVHFQLQKWSQSIFHFNFFLNLQNLC